jgi:hypothetical protein
MPNNPVWILLLWTACMPPAFAESRSFDAVFPGLSPEIRSAAFSAEGFINSANGVSGPGVFGGGPDGAYGIDPGIRNAVLDKNPGFLIEYLWVIPGEPGAVSLLDVYNALGKIRGLKGRLYFSESRGKNIPLFEDATRLQSAAKNTPVPDPGPAAAVPRSETIYIRLRDVNFGNTYYRGDLSLDQYGLRYRLSNHKNLSYLFIPVIKEERFTAQLYFEPLREGLLIYSIAGADVSDFIASKIDIPSAISKRLLVILSWVAEGIGKTGKPGG